MKKTIVENRFDNVARDYDKLKVQIIPKYREVEKLVLEYINFPKNQRIEILELGTGTGLFASKLLLKFPRARYFGIDLSDKMLEVASHKLKNYRDRVELQKVDLNKKELLGKYDLIVSFFTIHHVLNKKAFIEHLHKLLKKAGVFIFADVTIADHKILEDTFINRWKSFIKSTSLPNRKIKNIIDDHLQNDRPEDIEKLLAHFKKAGFKCYAPIWVYEKFALFYAKK